MFSGRMLRRETKTLERGSPGKRVKRAGSQGECALIRVRGLWRCACSFLRTQPSRRRARANFRYFSRTRAPSILLMNKLIHPVVQCGPTSLPRSSQHRRFGSLVFAQVQALDFGLFHSVEFSHMLYVIVTVQPGTWGTSFCFQGGAISSFQPESW